MIDKGILIYLFAFHRIPILLIIAQPQSLRYEQTAYTHNKAPFSTGMVRITVYWQDFAHTHFSQFSKNMLEFCILLLIPSMYVLILKSVFYQGRPILRKMPQCVFRASTYSTAQGHGTYYIKYNWGLSPVNLLTALELYSEQPTQLHTAHLPIR